MSYIDTFDFFSSLFCVKGGVSHPLEYAILIFVMMVNYGKVLGLKPVRQELAMVIEYEF